MANIAPPLGIPNAAAGMNPDAISDPQLRKQYLEKIASENAKQIENRQQSELRRARASLLLLAAGLVSADGKTGWSRADLMIHFAKDEESKAILMGRVSIFDR